MIPALDPSLDGLPSGRHSTTLNEVQDRFVGHPDFVASIRRPVIWSKFESAIELLRSAVPVCQLWIGGSFLTTKPEPDDIDCIFWVDEDRAANARRNARRAKIIDRFNSAEFKKAGVPLDAYVVSWHMNLDILAPDAKSWDYYRSRGYWEDLWSRKRVTAKGLPSVRLDTLPRRGYLEVTVDGWS